MPNGSHQPRLIRGVTLIETLAVVAILAVLMGVVWMAVAGRVKQGAKQAQIKSDMRQVVLAVNLYRGDNDGGLPAAWRDFGYYGIVKRGSDVSDTVWEKRNRAYDRYDKPLSYDVSYHTPECAQPPKAEMAFLMTLQAVAQFESRPRANTLDVDRDQALVFWPACLANSFAERHPRILRQGVVLTPLQYGLKSLGANLGGTISYQFGPDWHLEASLGS